MTTQSTNNLYGFPQPLSNVFPAPVIAQRAPLTTDIRYPIGQQWVDEVGDDAYILVDVTAASATWNVTATTPGNVDTLTGNSGGAITPSAGNINVVGSGVLAFAGAGSTLTGSITPGTALVSTVTGGSGGALSPTSGNINVLGTANQITSTGSGSSITLSIPSAVTAPGSLTTTTSLTAGNGFTVSAGTSTLAALTQVGTASINASGAGVTTIGTGGTGATNIGNATGNTAVTGSLTASTSLTATAGDITATLGNVIINGAAKQLRVHGGAATDFIGQATLSSGTVTVLNTNIAAGDKILVSRHGVNSSTALGVFNTAISAATSFTITALKPADATTETGDTSIVDYFIVRQV